MKTLNYEFNTMEEQIKKMQNEWEQLYLQLMEFT
jgi:sensor histidine kinase YesM